MMEELRNRDNGNNQDNNQNYNQRNNILPINNWQNAGDNIVEFQNDNNRPENNQP